MSAAGPQSRFILFLFLVLAAYTLLLKVFQKLAQIVDLPVFLPIALVTLLFFVGIVGIIYSHRFVGPITRIRRTLEQLAEGETNITLRLRESDDPMLKDLVAVISRLCEQAHDKRILITETANELFTETASLQDAFARNADRDEVQKRLVRIKEKQVLLDNAVKALGKGERC